MNKEEREEIRQRAREMGIDKVTFTDTRPKRLVKYMTSPGRLVWGLPIAYGVAWLEFHHHVNQGNFWIIYACWIVGTFLAFWLRELHAWAGGRRLGE